MQNYNRSTIRGFMNYEKEIQRLEKKLAVAKVKLAKKQGEKWRQLAKDNGFATIDLFIKAMAPFASPVLKGKLGAGTKTAVPVTAAAPVQVQKRRKRAVIDTKKREGIIADLKAGKMTAAQVAEKHKVSLPSVSNIKKAAGLVKSKKAAKK